MEFTPAQDTAIHARNRELLVSAAAGSGKTRVLIERIFAMLAEDGYSLDRLLVVTFTRAAAAEMRERLQTRLTEAAVNDPRMRRQSELLETAQISTLHSFCQKLVRAYFQEVDMDPLATLGDETVCANLRAQAMNDAMDALYERAAEDADAASLTAKFEDGAIARILDALLTFLTSLPDPFAWLADCAQKTYSMQDLRQGPMAETLLADCQTLLSGVEALCAANRALAEKPLCPEPYRKSIRGDEQAVRALAEASLGGLPAMMTAAAAFALDRMPSLRNLEGEEALIRDQYKQNRELLKKRVTTLRESLPQDPEDAIRKCNAMQPALRGLRALVQDADERYAALKRDRALLDFTDLERMTLTLLRNPDIRAEVADRFDAVFVDEYQDISGVQEAILNALKRDVSRETTGLPQRYFYVGDVKQSIYRFRQADPTLFMGKMRTFRTEENAAQRRVTLNANFRSRETVLHSVNRVFERVMRADVTEIEYDAEARLYAGVPSLCDPPTTVHLFTQAAKPAERVRLQALAIAREIRRRVGEPVLDRAGNPAGVLHFRDFAVLGAKMKGVADVLERTLTEMGIPVYSEDRGGGMQSAEIAQALNHLKLMDQLADDLALLSALRSPAMGFDDRELGAIRLTHQQGSFLDALRAAAQGEGALAIRCAEALRTFAHERFILMESRLDEYLWGWLNRSGMYAFYGCQPNGKLRQANLRMLCDRAGEHVKHRGGDLRDFLQSVQADTAVHDSKSPTVLSPWEDVVRVMTIHKSKGLEFPVVFVMGLEDSFTRRSDSRAAMHPRLGVALPYVNETTRTTDDTLLRSAIDLRARMEERAEKARLLYVAMTRAREELVLLGWKDDLPPQAAADGFAQNALPSAYAVANAKNMIGWVCDCLNANDTVEVLTDESETNNAPWKTESETDLSTQSTNNPQKRAGWRVVFHTGVRELTEAARLAKGANGMTELEIRRARLQALLEDARTVAAQEGMLPAATAEAQPASPIGAGEAGSARVAANAACLSAVNCNAADPLLPPLQFIHRPFKVGVTALVRAERAAAAEAPTLRPEEDADDAAVETVDQKRWPLPLTRPRLMSDLPTMPAFMRPPAEQTGVRRGVATHKTLSLLQWDALRAALAASALPADIARQVAALANRRQLTAEEAALVQPERIAAFFHSPIGRQALAAETVRREWSFNLRLADRGGLIAQGVIDLCFIRDGQWSLVDYKTDRVSTAEELWDAYGEQIALYRRALAEAGGAPVRDATLYSLALGEGSTRE